MTRIRSQRRPSFPDGLRPRCGRFYVAHIDSSGDLSAHPDGFRAAALLRSTARGVRRQGQRHEIVVTLSTAPASWIVGVVNAANAGRE
jgi:hypothetical protein